MFIELLIGSLAPYGSFASNITAQCSDGLYLPSLGIKSVLFMMVLVLVLECYPVPEEDLLERCVRVGEVFRHRANRGIVHQLVWVVVVKVAMRTFYKS